MYVVACPRFRARYEHTNCQNRARSRSSWPSGLHTIAFPFRVGRMEVCYLLSELMNYPQTGGTRPIAEVQVNRRQNHFVLPELLTQFRSRLDEALLKELLALQAAAAIEEGAVSPAHVVVDTFPSEQGSQRVNDAATLYKAKKKSSRLSRRSRSNAPPRGRP